MKTLSDCLALYVRHLEARIKPKTLTTYSRFLRVFEESFGSRRPDSIKPHELEEWSERPTWGPTTRSQVLELLSCFYRWAVKTERAKTNPALLAEKPRQRSRGADVLITEEQHQALLRAARFSTTVFFLTALRETGARPGEVSAVTAADFDPTHSTWTLRTHKTSKKTDRPRVVYLTPTMVEICQALVTRWPTGPLFRNSKGQPWSQLTVSMLVRRLADRAGLPKTIIAYSYRHTFATDALSRGVPEAQVAELLGHHGTEMLHRHYSHLLARRDVLKEALSRIRNG